MDGGLKHYGVQGYTSIENNDVPTVNLLKKENALSVPDMPKVHPRTRRNMDFLQSMSQVKRNGVIEHEKKCEKHYPPSWNDAMEAYQRSQQAGFRNWHKKAPLMARSDGYQEEMDRLAKQNAINKDYKLDYKMPLDKVNEGIARFKYGFRDMPADYNNLTAEERLLTNGSGKPLEFPQQNVGDFPSGLNYGLQQYEVNKFTNIVGSRTNWS